jgi:hypothetical protein
VREEANAAAEGTRTLGAGGYQHRPSDGILDELDETYVNLSLREGVEQTSSINLLVQ